MYMYKTYAMLYRLNSYPLCVVITLWSCGGTMRYMQVKNTTLTLYKYLNLVALSVVVYIYILYVATYYIFMVPTLISLCIQHVQYLTWYLWHLLHYMTCSMHTIIGIVGRMYTVLVHIHNIYIHVLHTYMYVIHYSY